MRRVCPILAVVAVLWFAPCFAGDTERRRELAAELLEALDMKATLAKSFETTKAMVPGQMQQMRKNLPLQGPGGEAMKSVAEKTMDLVAEEMSWEKMQDEYVAIYAEVFTADEMEGLIAFYRSPVGKAYVAKQPDLMQRTMAVSQKAMTRLMPKLMALQAGAALKAAIPNATPAPPKRVGKEEPVAEEEAEEPAVAK